LARRFAADCDNPTTLSAGPWRISARRTVFFAPVQGCLEGAAGKASRTWYSVALKRRWSGAATRRLAADP
jgi:hypothetical protein